MEEAGEEFSTVADQQIVAVDTEPTGAAMWVGMDFSGSFLPWDVQHDFAKPSGMVSHSLLCWQGSGQVRSSLARSQVPVATPAAPSPRGH